MVAQVLEKLTLSLALTGIATVAFLAAGGFLTAAFYLWLLESMSIWAAALLTGAVVLLVAIALFVLGRLALKPHAPALPRNPAPPAPEPQVQAIQMISALAGEEIGRFLHERPKSATGIALVAGLAIGLSPELRSSLGALIAPEKH